MTTATVHVHARGGPVVGTMLILLGALLLADHLGWIDVDFWEILLPALLIALGVRLLARRTVVVRTAEATADSAAPPRATETHPGDRIDEQHVLGEFDVAVDSRTFRGGTLSTVFGEVRIDLTHAALADGEQRLTVNTVFGSVRVFVPHGWQYCVQANTAFGEVEAANNRRGGVFTRLVIATPEFDTAARRLRLDVSTVFGEVRVVER